jgi:hypothetical protein
MISILLQTLASQGLSLLASAIQAKGKDVIESKLGVSLDTTPPHILREKEIEHEEFLLSISIKQKELDLQAETAAQGAVTERWKADMLSDSWLSKNIRPLVLAFLTVCIVFLAALPITVGAAWIELLESSYMLVLGAYFVGRTWEKHVDMKERGKVE